MSQYYLELQSIDAESSTDPKDIGRTFLGALDRLNRIDPVFSDWTLVDWPGQAIVSLKDARRDIAALVEKNIVRDKRDEPIVEEGYHVIACNTLVVDSRTATLSAKLGGATNRWTLSIGVDDVVPDDSILTSSIVRPAFLALISVWPTPWARVVALKVKDPTQPSPRDDLPKRLTWIGYLSADWARGVAAPGGIRSERTSDGGMLLTATADRPDPTKPDEMRLCGVLAAFMDKNYRDPWLPR